MISALRSEWIKLRTIRMNLVLVILAVAFPLIVTVLVMTLADVEDVRADETIEGISGFSVVTAMLLGVVGAATITGEFGFGTIRVTFAAIPRRMVVLVAKGIITVVTALVVEAVVVFTCLGAASAIASARDVTFTLDEARSGLAPMYGVVVFAALVALLGYGLGLLIRNTAPAIAVLILWPLVGEGIVALILSAAGVDEPFKWLPYQNALNMSSVDTGDESLGRVAGGLYFLAVTAVVTGIGAFFTARRDA